MSHKSGYQLLKNANTFKPIRKLVELPLGDENEPIVIKIDGSDIIRLNKVQEKVIPILGDVREKSQQWFDKCDRVIMPLPHEARKYLELSYKCLKSGRGIIHLYIIEPENEVEENIKKLMKEFQEKIKSKISYKIRKVLPYSPRTNKYCVDIQVTKDD